MDKKHSFLDHVKSLRAKMMLHVSMIKRIAAERWGIRQHVLKVLYKAVALPIVKHGTILWYDVRFKSNSQERNPGTSKSIDLIDNESMSNNIDSCHASHCGHQAIRLGDR